MEATERVSQVIVRTATLGDIPWLENRAHHYNNIPGNSFFLVDPDVLLNHIKDTILNHVAFVAERNDQIVGFISGLAKNHPYATPPDGFLILAMTHWWVEESFRGSRAGLLLLTTFTDWGKENVDRIVMSLPVESNMDPASLSKRGFELRERAFAMEV